MTRQRRHFEVIAETLREVRDSKLGQTREEAAQARIQWERTVAAFAHNLRATNPNFNRDRFIRACGWEA